MSQTNSIVVNFTSDAQIAFKNGKVSVDKVEFHKNEDGSIKTVHLADGRVSKLGYVTFSTEVTSTYETSLYGISALRNKEVRDSSISYISNIIVSEDTTEQSIMAELRKRTSDLRMIERRGLTLNLTDNELRAINAGKVDMQKLAVRKLILRPGSNPLEASSYMSVTINGVAYPVYRDTIMGTAKSLEEYTTDFSKGANARFNFYQADAQEFLANNIDLDFTLDELISYLQANA